MKTTIWTILKGLFVGSTMLVPGVSGGSMAMILGEYDKLILAVSSFFKEKKANAIYLGLFALGGFTGMILFAKPILYCINHFPMPMLYFFIGTVAGGVPLIYEKANIHKISLTSLLYLVMGIVIAILLSVFLPQNLFGSHSHTSMLILVAAGFIAAIALVLPGISVSYLLLIMGIYDTVMTAISHLQIAILLPMGAGLLCGIIATTKALEYAMQQAPQATYMIILGFILASVAQIFPGIPSGIYWLICPAACLLGYLAIRQLPCEET